MLVINEGNFMRFDTCYRVNTPHVILETFADEVVIVNLESGNYYSLDKAGAEVWALLAEGLPWPRIVRHLGRLYLEPEAELDRHLRGWMAQLLAENLLVEVDNVAAADRDEPAAPLAEKRSFVPPVLHKYEDMQELLLLDPIHDVDEAGWPKVKPAE